jgi:hypothetical protein
MCSSRLLQFNSDWTEVFQVDRMKDRKTDFQTTGRESKYLSRVPRTRKSVTAAALRSGAHLI